jgi:hypothetical protein
MAEIVAHRERREGKVYKLPKATEKWVREEEEAGRKATEEIDKQVPTLPDEQIIELAFHDWYIAVEGHAPLMYGHEDDRAFAERIDRHHKSALRLIKSFYRTHGMPLPHFGSGGGICFMTAFEKPIPDIGTLGADCISIEPALATLDRLAEKAGLSPISRFVNRDPHALTGEKPAWFNPADGLGAVQGLLERLGRSSRAVKNGKQVAQELKTVERELIAAARDSVRFHFVMLD